jgi:hypothetical protein
MSDPKHQRKLYPTDFTRQVSIMEPEAEAEVVISQKTVMLAYCRLDATVPFNHASVAQAVQRGTRPFPAGGGTNIAPTTTLVPSVWLAVRQQLSSHAPRRAGRCATQHMHTGSALW